MKTQILPIALFLQGVCLAQASGVRIEKTSEPGVALNGQTINAYNETPEFTMYFNVVNITLSSMQMKWERSYCNGNPNFVLEQVCDSWNCIELPLNTDIWSLSGFRNIDTGEFSVFEPKVVFNESPCDSALVCYYILNHANERIDSIKIHYFYFNLQVCPEFLSTESSYLNDLSVYPNPSYGQVSFSHNLTNCYIKVYDNFGVLVKSIDDINAINTVDLSSLTKGIYHLSIQSQNGVFLKHERIVID